MTTADAPRRSLRPRTTPEIARQIRQARKETGATLASLAAQFGFSYDTIHRILNNTLQPDDSYRPGPRFKGSTAAQPFAHPAAVLKAMQEAEEKGTTLETIIGGRDPRFNARRARARAEKFVKHITGVKGVATRG